jgi:hypothetical protein
MLAEKKTKRCMPGVSSAVVITDCADDNARVHQQSRFSVLFEFQAAYLRVSSCAPDVEAAGNLVDQIDAAKRRC